MTAWRITLTALILGIGIGVGSALLKISRFQWDHTGDGPIVYTETAPPKPAVPPPSSVGKIEQPKVVVEKTSFDFGTMDPGAKGKHDYVFRNEGNAPLELAKGKTSCSCTMTNLERVQIAPGQSTKVTLDWKVKGFEGTFNQWATVNTNDPQRPSVTLNIVGHIASVVRTVPETLILSSVVAGEKASGTIRVFSYEPLPLKVSGQEFTDPESARWFEAAVVPMKPAEVAVEKDAKSGILAEINLKPGLPLGEFKQTIRLKINSAKLPSVEVPIRGVVVGDVSVIGAGSDYKHDVLAIGSVKAQEGAERKLIVIGRGRSRDQLKLKVVDKWPEFLQVDIGATTAGRNENTTPIIVRIPKGSPPANHWGTEASPYGRIQLETSQPRAPKLLIHVQFAVEG